MFVFNFDDSPHLVITFLPDFYVGLYRNVTGSVRRQKLLTDSIWILKNPSNGIRNCVQKLL